MEEGRPENPWRQGYVISLESAEHLGIVHRDGNDDPIAIVVSHDCDLASMDEREADCEIIVGRVIESDEVNGDCSGSKNPRQLHITFSDGEITVCAEFNAADKRTIAKVDLLKHVPATNVRLNPSEKSIFQNWLAIRYRRASFADEFDKRFKEKKLYKKFTEIIKKTRVHLIAVLLDVDAGVEKKRAGPEDTYSLTIMLLFDVSKNSSEAEKAAKNAAIEIDKLFEDQCKINGQWKNIELRACEAVSEAAMSVYESRLYKEWHFDHLSLRDDPLGKTLN